MNEVYQKLENCLKAVRKVTDFEPEIGIILGSGLGNFASKVKKECEVSYSDIEGFPVSTVAGHAGKYIFGYIGDKKVVLMQGRVHHYEGYKITDVVLPTRLMFKMGAKKLVLTNAAGGMGDGFEPGDFMLITDHISSFVPSPLVGANIDELGPRFPDMSHIYDADLSKIIEETAKENNISLKKGVYVQTSGPAYESPAEIRMYKTLGASAVGMSTAVEAIAAVHCGMKVCGISCISNLAAGISKRPLSHEEVKETADRVSKQFEVLVYNSVLKM